MGKELIKLSLLIAFHPETPSKQFISSLSKISVLNDKYMSGYAHQYFVYRQKNKPLAHFSLINGC